MSLIGRSFAHFDGPSFVLGMLVGFIGVIAAVLLMSYLGM